MSAATPESDVAQMSAHFRRKVVLEAHELGPQLPEPSRRFLRLLTKREQRRVRALNRKLDALLRVQPCLLQQLAQASLAPRLLAVCTHCQLPLFLAVMRQTLDACAALTGALSEHDMRVPEMEYMMHEKDIALDGVLAAAARLVARCLRAYTFC
ncbi:MAG: hypothetical protein MHM6MM_007257 [Cercozoa sp. M6MM]